MPAHKGQQVWSDSSAACRVEILVWVRLRLWLASTKMAVASRAMVASVGTTWHDVATSVPSSRPRENREVEHLMFRSVTMIRVNFSSTLRSAAFWSEKFCLGMFRKKYGRGACSCVFLVVFCFITTIAVAAEPEEKLPPDIRKFFHDANICRYLSGEWDNDLPQKRKHELNIEINKTCTNIYDRQESMKRKYSHNQYILSKITEYEF